MRKPIRFEIMTGRSATKCLVFAVLFCLPGTPNAWDKNVHPELNDLGAELVKRTDTEDAFYKEIHDYKDKLRDGGLDEDENKGEDYVGNARMGKNCNLMPYARARKHFYHPILKEGLSNKLRITALQGYAFQSRVTGTEGTGRCMDAVTWARNDDDQGLTWSGAIESYGYTKQSKEEAYFRLGHVGHLTADLAQPDHVLLEPHSAESAAAGTHLEGQAYLGVSSSIDVYAWKYWDTMKPGLGGLEPVSYDRMELFLEKLALETYEVGTFSRPELVYNYNIEDELLQKQKTLRNKPHPVHCEQATRGAVQERGNTDIDASTAAAWNTDFDAPTTAVRSTVYFTTPNDTDVIVEPGIYKVESRAQALRLTSEGGQPTFLVVAEESTHDQEVTRPTAIAFAGETEEEQDLFGVALLLPDGQVHVATGSLSGVSERGLPKIKLPKIGLPSLPSLPKCGKENEKVCPPPIWCDHGFKEGADDRCHACGGNNQIPCTAPTGCLAGNIQNLTGDGDGLCHACGGQGQVPCPPPKGCRPGLNRNEAGRCSDTCGGEAQTSCGVLEGCKQGYAENDDYQNALFYGDRKCHECGRDGQHPCTVPVGCRVGYMQDLTISKIDRVCRECGREDQYPCPPPTGCQAGFDRSDGAFTKCQRSCERKIGNWDGKYNDDDEWFNAASLITSTGTDNFNHQGPYYIERSNRAVPQKFDGKENVDGQTLEHLFVEDRLPRAVEHIAGLYKHFFEIVNHPPILVKAEVLQATECTYQKEWRLSGGTRSPKNGCPGSEGNGWINGVDGNATVRLTFGTANDTGASGAAKRMKDVTVSIENADGRLELIGQSTNGETEWVGEFALPADRSLDGERKLMVRGKDRSPHLVKFRDKHNNLVARNYPGDELDSDPSTLALVESDEDEGYDWKGYVPGTDTNHTIRIDTTPPEIALVRRGVDEKGRTIEVYAISDRLSGVGSIDVVTATNATTTIEPFSPSDNATNVTITVVDQRQSAEVNFKSTDVAGNPGNHQLEVGPGKPNRGRRPRERRND